MERDQDNSFEKSHRLSLQQTDDAVSPYELTAILNTNSIRLVAIIKKHTSVEMRALTQLGDLVYPGGGKELCDLVTAVQQGKKANL